MLARVAATVHPHHRIVDLDEIGVVGAVLDLHLLRRIDREWGIDLRAPHALGGLLDEKPVLLPAVSQRPLCTPMLGHIDPHRDDVLRLALAVPEERGCPGQEAAGALLGDPVVLRRSGCLPGQEIGEDATHGLHLLRQEQEIPEGTPAHFVGRVARGDLAGPVEPGDAALPVEHRDQRRDRIQHGGDEVRLALHDLLRRGGEGDLLGHYQPGRPALELHCPAGDPDQRHRAVLPSMTPDHGMSLCARFDDLESLLEQRYVLRGPEVVQGQLEELIPAVAVLLHGGAVDVEQAEGLEIEDPHGQRAVLEVESLAGFLLRGRVAARILHPGQRSFAGAAAHL